MPLSYCIHKIKCRILDSKANYVKDINLPYHYTLRLLCFAGVRYPWYRISIFNKRDISKTFCIIESPLVREMFKVDMPQPSKKERMMLTVPIIANIRELYDDSGVAKAKHYRMTGNKAYNWVMSHFHLMGADLESVMRVKGAHLTLDDGTYRVTIEVDGD